MKIARRMLAIASFIGSLYFFYYAGRFLIEGGHATLVSDNPRDSEDDVIPGLLLFTALLAAPGLALVAIGYRLWRY